MKLTFEQPAIPAAFCNYLDYCFNVIGKNLSIPDNIEIKLTFFDSSNDFEIYGNAFQKNTIYGAVLMFGPFHDSRNQTEFEMILSSSIDPGTLLLVIAHELIHVQQYVHGALETVIFANIPLNRWMGSNVSPITAYDEQPWEIDAHSRQNEVLACLVEDSNFFNEVQKLKASMCAN